MLTVDAPYLPVRGDPAETALKISRSKKGNIGKYLTIVLGRHIIKSTINERTAMANKPKTQTNYMQIIAVCLLATGAILGFADQLGGGLKACLVSVLLVVALFVMAVDYRK